MRSRSSRLFVVLLHLVGVSTNLPRHPFHSGVGIIGVHPLSILLEPLELQAAGGLEELLALLEGAGYDVDETVLREPFWLQDDTDGTCLGPSGFSECGDATLWKIRRRAVPAYKYNARRTKRQRQRNHDRDREDNPRKGFLAFFEWNSRGNAENEGSATKTEWEYALELADVDTSSLIANTDADANNQNIEDEVGECIVSMAVAMDGEGQNQDSPNQDETLQMAPCSLDEAWSWTINEGGMLKWERHHNTKRGDDSPISISKLLFGPLSRLINRRDNAAEAITGNDYDLKCVGRMDGASATSTACQSDGDGDGTTSTSIENPVSFSVIQYQKSAAKSPQLPRFPSHNDLQRASSDSSSIAEKRQKDKTDFSRDHASANANANANAGGETTSSSLPHMRSKSTNSARVQPQEQMSSQSSKARLSSLKEMTPNSMPIHGNGDIDIDINSNSARRREIISPLGVGGYFERKITESKVKVQPGRTGGSILHHPPSSSASSPPSSITYDDIPHMPKKIPVHPYIEASTDGLYEDPITGMSFPTDISEYLGHDRKVTGRHTLTGVGVYTRTMLKIKVYGLALYVSKRDALADPSLIDYASMDTDELQNSLSFYDLLMTMGEGRHEGNFDRTLFIKLNMQLSLDTVRQSLSGDWQLLSQDHKDMLSDSSSKERVAEEQMLNTIKNEENTSNCSCGQVAPPEYEADKSCCARGTELVFTWRKNGDIELRIDGRMMDTFPYPEIGRGIFYEYLRDDDPMSVESRLNFVDGFPFLLAPLAQLRGFVPKSESSTGQKSAKAKTSERNIIKTIGDTFDTINSRSKEALDQIQDELQSGISNLKNTVQTINSATHNIVPSLQKLNADIDAKRGLWWKGVLEHTDESIKDIIKKVPLIGNKLKLEESFEDVDISLDNQTETEQNIFRPQIAKMFVDPLKQRPVSDEIGVIIEPTMGFTHMMFLYMVHFYLVLLLIVSVPDSSSTQVVKRSSASTLDSESDLEERCLDLNRSMSDHMEEGCNDWNETSVSIPAFIMENDNMSMKNDLTASQSEERERTLVMKKALSYCL